MTDYFAVLGQERRPWLDEGELKSRYLELTRTTHPDLNSGGNFEVVREAYDVLREPQYRLLHLLALAGTPPSSSTGIAPELGDLFSRMNKAEEGFREWSERRAAASPPLVQAVLAKDRSALREGYEALHRELQKYDLGLRTELQRIDLIWEAERKTATEAIVALASQFSFTGRWRGQVKERLVELSND